MRGVAVIYVGEDLDVLLELADRILVLCGGKVSGIVPGRGAKKRDVGMMMTKLGGKADEYAKPKHRCSTSPSAAALPWYKPWADPRRGTAAALVLCAHRDDACHRRSTPCRSM